MKFISFDLESYDDTVPAAEEPVITQHRIVAVGRLVLNTSLPVMVEEFDVDVAASVIPDRAAERQLLLNFSGLVEQFSPNYEQNGKLNYDFLTFNGHRWDFPLLMLRGLLHGVPMPWYTETKGTTKPFDTEGHLDICQYLSRGRFLGMSHVARLVGLPGKQETSGSDVQRLVQEGRTDTLADYCASDTFQQTVLGLRVSYLRGLIGIQKYNAVAVQLLSHGLKCQFPSVRAICSTSNILLSDE